MVWGAFGLCLGSFANVVIARLPQDESVVRPRSRCPGCRKPIAWQDNIPLLSFLWLLGRCRRCRAPIALRYPLVEGLVGALACGLGNRWGGHPAWAFLALLAAWTLVVIAFIDWDTFLIPDVLSLGLLAAGLLVAPLNPMLGGGPLARLGFSLLGAAVGLGLCWFTAWAGEAAFGREAMGGGDIKLLAAVGAWSGGLGAFDCLILASLLGSVYGVGLMLGGRLRRSDPIPFGPFLSAGALFGFFHLLPFGFPFNL